MAWIRRHGWFAVALVLLTAGALWLKAGLVHKLDSGSEQSFDIGGPFQLTASDGKPVTQASWPGQLMLVAFGYRYCPDICPTLLQGMAETMDALGNDGARVQPLFISVDPERDTPAELASYVKAFHPRLLGLTGTAEQVAAVAKAFRVYYRKVPGATPDSYTMDHSAFVYLIDGRGIVIKIFGHGATPADMATAVRDFVHRLPS